MWYSNHAVNNIVRLVEMYNIVRGTITVSRSGSVWELQAI